MNMKYKIRKDPPARLASGYS